MPCRSDPALISCICQAYDFDTTNEVIDLGGSCNLNLRVKANGHAYVARAYRPYVSQTRLEDIQQARKKLTAGGIPCAKTLLTRKGCAWIEHDHRLVEVEAYIDHDSHMNTWERLAAALPMLGHIHAILQDSEVSPEGKQPAFTNALDPQMILENTRSGTRRMRSWVSLPFASRLAQLAEELADRVIASGAHYFPLLPKQLVHGDFWDTNVLFDKDEIALITDFDFMGERFRINDLALTLYFTSMEYALSPLSDTDIRRLKHLVDAYDSGLTHPLSRVERTALPIMIAAQPLWSIGGWVAQLDNETTAQEHATGTVSAVEWALELMQNLERWQTVFA